MNRAKPFEISKQIVMDAWRQVKRNAGAAGIDKVEIADFEINLKANLYKIWNRMSSGCYMPPDVKAVPIPKKSGGVRMLGVPTIGDRIAQTVVKFMIEPRLESAFLPDSYGYRPNKSAHDALRITRQRCWQYDWLIEFDIRGLFDNLSHELLLKAVRHHVSEQWCVLYIERWLRAGMVCPDKSRIERCTGTPQGGVISPCLSNLFLHYCFDRWLTTGYPGVPWCRYADDGVVHCRTLKEARMLLEALRCRFLACGLELHPEKTKIVYCKDSNRKLDHEVTQFSFLGYAFKQRLTINKRGQFFMGFIPAMSDSAFKGIKETIKLKWKIDRRTDLSLEEIAKKINPVLRGWIGYYGKFYKSYMARLARYVNEKLSKWFRKKYLNGQRKIGVSYNWLKRVYRRNPSLFVHWEHWKAT